MFPIITICPLSGAVLVCGDFRGIIFFYYSLCEKESRYMAGYGAVPKDISDVFLTSAETKKNVTTLDDEHLRF